MRLFPNPWQGLHPAFSESPAPLSASAFTSAPTVGASVGLYGVAVGAFLKERPTMGLTAAAYTMVLAGCGYAALTHVEGNTARRFLETKGIEVPKRKIVERLGSFDQDNVLLLGALVGIAVAGRRIRPQHLSRFSWYGGAACFGTLGSTMVLKVAPWPARREAAEQGLKNAMIAQQYQGEVIAAVDPEMKDRWWPQMNRQSGTPNGPSAPPASIQGGQETDQRAGPLRAALALFLGPSGFGDGDISEAETLSALEIAQSDQLDEDDPKPHLSNIEDGERVFKPVTNYKWSPRSHEDAQRCLNQHIDHLKKRREGISKEAELLWHTVATKEAEYYETKNDTPLKAEQRAALEIMNEIHINIWLQTSMVDWMIADSTKNLLQVEAMTGSEKGLWIPPLPKTAENIKPKLTGKFLAELSDANNKDLALLKQLEIQPPSDAHPNAAADWRTGDSVDRETAHQVASDAVERALTECENRQKALNALLDDIDRRNSN